MKNTSINILLLYFCLLCRIGNLYSQESYINRAPDFLKIETPNAAAFNKYIDYPVSLYTGTPDISIPLYNLKDGMIELPIVLRYNSSGIKVIEEASWVGLGWNLNMGGVIVKNAIGGGDEYDTSTGYTAFLEKLNLTWQNPEGFAITHLTKEMYDTQKRYLLEPLSHTGIRGKLNPDVYNLSYPNGNGKFVIDNRNNIIFQIERNNGIKIVKIGDQGFRILEENGVSHLFVKHSSLVNDISNPNGLVTSTNFVLNETSYPNGQTVKYIYDKIPYKSSSFSQSFQATDPDDRNIGGYSYFNNGLVTTLYGYEFVLRKIETTNYSIYFDISSRLDIEEGKKLDNIRITPNNSPNSTIKKYNFHYEYFQGYGSTIWNSHQITNDHRLKRLKLLSVEECHSSTNNINNQYKFTYNNESLPPKNSFAVDYWGYHNGKSANKTLLPDLKYLFWDTRHGTNEEKLLKISSMKNYMSLRASEERYCMAGILTGIEYPTGGYSEFQYELNSFIGYYIPTVTDISTIGVITYEGRAEDQNNPSIKNTHVFTLDRVTTVNLDVYLSRGLNDWYKMRGHSVMIRTYNSSSTLMLELNYDGDCSRLYQTGSTIGVFHQESSVTLGPGTYNLIVDIPNSLGDQYGSQLKHGSISAILSYDKYTSSNKSESKGAGLRIKSIKKYNAKTKNKLLGSKYYEYKANSNTSGILHEKCI